MADRPSEDAAVEATAAPGPQLGPQLGAQLDVKQEQSATPGVIRKGMTLEVDLTYLDRTLMKSLPGKLSIL